MKEFETTKQNKQKCIKHDITMQMGKHGRRIIIRFYFKLLLTMQGTFEYLVFLGNQVLFALSLLGFGSI